jgi:Uma2 family endonuclease
MRRGAPTPEDVFRLDSRGTRVEIVDGQLVEMPPNGFDHGAVISRVAARLLAYAREGDLGLVVIDVLFDLRPDPRMALAPAVAYVRRERVPRGGRSGAFLGAPDIAVEVAWPDDRLTLMRRKARRWLDAGTQIVVLLLARPPRVEVHRASGVAVSQGTGLVDLSPLLPSVPAAELFPPSLPASQKP